MLSSREKISIRQAVILFIMTVYSASIRLFPTYSARVGKRAGWLTPIFALLPFICLVYIIHALFKNNKEANLSDIIFKSLGRILGSILLIFYLIWNMITFGINVRYFAERFLTSLLPNTPIQFFTITILAIIFYVAQGGLVYITRTTEFLFLIFSVAFAVLFLLTLPSVDLINLFPVTHYDVLPLVKSSLSNISIWSVFAFTFFFGDKINDKEHIKRFGMQGAAYLVISALMILIQTIGIYGYSVIERVPLPYVFVVKSISLLETLERIESVAVASWVIVDFVTLSVNVFVMVSIIKSLFSLSEGKWLASPVIIFAFIFSQYAAKSRFELEDFSNIITLPANIILGFGFPLIILIIGKIRKKI